MRIRSHIVLLLLAASIALADAHAAPALQRFEGPGVSVRVVNGDSVLVSPGQIHTIVFKIINGDKRAQTFSPTLQLPDGWLLANSITTQMISKGGSAILFATIRIPSSAHAGEYSIPLDVIDTDTSDPIASITAFISVDKVFGLDLTVSQPADFTPAGQELVFKLIVTNTGNVRATYEIESGGSHDISVRLDENKFELGPQESRTIEGRMPTDGRLDHKIKQQAHFRASIKEDPGTFSSIQAHVNVIPLYTRLRPKAPAIPIQLAIQSVGDEWGNSTQLGVKGEIDALGGTLSIDLNLSQRKRVPMFGSRDSYRLRFESERLSLQVGDHVRRLSPLTTTGQYGTGLSAIFKTGKFEYSGGIQKTRYVFPTQSFVTGSAKYNASNTLSVSTNILHRSGLYDGTVITARTQLTPFGKAHQLDFECGLDSNGGFSDPSCLLDFSGSTSRLGYQGRIMRSSETYPGSSSDLIHKSGGLSYRFQSGFRVDGTFLSQKRGFSQDFGRTTTQYRIGAGISSRIGPASTFFDVHYLGQRLSHLGLGFEVDRRESIVRVRTGIQLRSFGLQGSIDTGRAESRANNYRGSVFRTRITARTTPLRRLTLSASGDYASGYLVNTAREMRRWLISGQMTVQFGSRTQISTTIYRSTTESLTRHSYTSFQSLLRHTFRSGHQLMIQAQHSRIIGSRALGATDYRVSYSLPIGIPFGKASRNDGFVSGHIFDAETNEPISGALLFLGDGVTISDDKGLFKIPITGTGAQYLRLDQKSIGFDRVSIVPMPFKISADDVLPDVLELPVVRASEVTGTISLIGPPDGEQMLGLEETVRQKISSVKGAVIEVSSRDSRHRSRSDRSGRFSFKHLPPGRYQVRIVSIPLKGNYRIEPDSVEVLLDAGTSISLGFNIKPVIRRIKMIDVSERTLDIEPSESLNEKRVGQIGDSSTSGIPPTRPDRLLKKAQPTRSSNWFDLLEKAGTQPEPEKDSVRSGIDTGKKSTVTLVVPLHPISTRPNRILLLALAAAMVALMLVAIWRISRAGFIQVSRRTAPLPETTLLLMEQNGRHTRKAA